MKILVTGGSGFLGTTLVATLRSHGHEVRSLDSKSCDLRLAGSLDPFNGEAFEQIYHLAAWTQAGDFCLHHPAEQWIINQQINVNVLTWWRERQPQAKMVAIGTSCSYDPEMELSEDNYLVGTPIDSLFTYAMTKRMLYVGLRAFQRQFGLRYLHVVPSTLYGPGYHTDGRQMHFIFDLMRKILRGKKYQETVTLWGDGHQKRELVFVGDFVAWLVQLTETLDNELINLGAGEEYSIRDFARFISEIVGFDPENIQYDLTKYVGSRSKCLNITKLQQKLPNRQITPLSEGLLTTIEWFKGHLDSV